MFSEIISNSASIFCFHRTNEGWSLLNCSDLIYQVKIACLKYVKSPLLLTPGPRSMKRNLVGTGTSVKSPKCEASERRMNAESGLSSSFNSPTRMLEASAPGGIFFMKWLFLFSNSSELLLRRRSPSLPEPEIQQTFIYLFSMSNEKSNPCTKFSIHT